MTDALDLGAKFVMSGATLSCSVPTRCRWRLVRSLCASKT
jgi:hypothetical protein